MGINEITGSILGTMVITGARKLESEKSKIDNLNVFPVPDGDTGTNMSLTLISAARFVKKLPEDASLDEIAEAMSYGALMGARGNSGVILSQLLGGFSKAVKGQKEMDAILLAEAFEKGVEKAYKAVVKPIEGTILTVAREASSKLSSSVQKEMDLEEAVNIFLTQGYETLAKTPEMLPVLKQAGVVDAGGQGFLTVIEGMLAGLRGESVDTILEESFSGEKRNVNLNLNDKPSNIEFFYCTELLVRNFDKDKIDTNIIKKFLQEQGDSVVLVTTDDFIKIHVHTNNPGKVLDYCVQLGTLHNMKIENMQEQSENNQLMTPMKNIGIVAVSIGEGLNDIFKSLGVDYIITGGQTMNPSTEDLVEAINQVNAEKVIILPNNKNIILSAEQAIGLTQKPSSVLKTKTIPQGIGALMAFNGENDIETNLEKMQEAITYIKSGEVTYAVRDAKQGERDIKSGQILGIEEGKITELGEDVNKVVIKLVDRLIEEEEELVTLYYGEDITENQAEELIDILSSNHPDVDFELHYGGQPLYYYLISVE